MGYAIEAPKYKYPITNKLQWFKFQTIPNRSKIFRSFEIEVLGLFGICNLIFGI
jgi:hypothetical protein